MEIELDRIYNMDCVEGMQMLPQGNKYVVVSDPPFNVGYHYNEYKDNKDDGEYYAWLADIVGERPCAIIHYPESLYKFAFQVGKFPERVVSWVYNSNTPRQHRDIAYFDIKPDLTKVRQPYKNPEDHRIAARIAAGCEGSKMYDWMEINQVKGNAKKGIPGAIHPCQMPEEVMRRVVGVLPDDYVIVDPFMGSGTTAIAAIRNKRHFIGFEINADYFRIAERRIYAEQAQLSLFD